MTYTSLFKYFIASSMSIILLASCTPKSTDQQVQDTVSANQNAKSYLEWNSSEDHPNEAFKKWKSQIEKKEITTTDLCKTLLNIPASDLVMFEENIKDKSNEVMIKECKPQLIEKMEAYWLEQKKKTGASNEVKSRVWSTEAMAAVNFRFPDKVKSVDLSAGFFATTGPTDPKEVILTFDDGPHGQYTESILNSLANVNAKAIFFAMGKNVRTYPQITKKVAQLGHAIGGHSMTHLCLPASDRCRKSNGGRRLTSSEGKIDIASSMKEIFKVLGFVDPYFRFPYGESSTDLKQFLRTNQVGEFYWSNDSNDWRSRGANGEEWTVSRMIESVMSQLNRSKRGVILMHDVQRKTEVALPTLLKRLYFEGYTPVLLRQSEAERLHPKIVENPTY